MNLKKIKWNEESYREFLNYLESIRDNKYKEFNGKIIKSKYPILGVKIPVLRKMAREIYGGDYEAFLEVIDNKYYECVMLKGLVIAQIKELDVLDKYLLPFINLIDNWAICDTFCNSLKIVDKNKDYFLNIINDLIDTKEEYKVRVGLILLLSYYVWEDYLTEIFNYIKKSHSTYYYVNMARAWLLCECFIKDQEKTLEFFREYDLDKFTINKSISKIRDSYRVSEKAKEEVLKFRKG